MVLQHRPLTRQLWIALPCLSSGILLSAIWVFNDRVSWANALLLLLPMSVVLSFILPSAYYVSRSLPFTRRRSLNIVGLYAGTVLLSGLLWTGLCWLWNMLILSFELPWANLIFDRSMLLILLAVACTLYLLALLIFDLLFAFTQFNDAVRRQSELQVLARDAELQMLRMQINPHFLFNSLNSISALTSIDPAGARTMAIELAQFFRQTLTLSEQSMIPLRQEVQLCQHFLSIEKIRFGAKLQSTFELPDSILEALLPPMVLQPLLENAIKHGQLNAQADAIIRVTGQMQSGWLHLRVSNPIAVLHPDSADEHIRVTAATQASGSGTGLKNLRARFHALYGEQCRVDWRREADQFIVLLSLPFQTTQSLDQSDLSSTTALASFIE